MIATGKHLHRRTVLRGLGAALALPLLDSMAPAHAAMRRTAAAPVRRFGAFYVPMGMNMPQWMPAKEGPLEIGSILRPLAAHRDRILLLTGLDSEPAVPGLED